MPYHQAESKRPSIALRFSLEQVSQKYWRTPFSTEQIQVGRGPSAVVPQRAHTRGWGSVAEPLSSLPPGRLVTRRRYRRGRRIGGHNAPRGPVRANGPAPAGSFRLPESGRPSLQVLSLTA